MYHISSHPFEFLYIVTATTFVILQGVYYYKWHPKARSSFDIKDDPEPQKKREDASLIIFFRGTYTTEFSSELLLNTLGSLIGWIAGYYLAFYRIVEIFQKLDPKFSDLVIILIAFYGMNGQLPNIIYNKVDTILTALAKKLEDK